jgi:hypothetical protein
MYCRLEGPPAAPLAFCLHELCQANDESVRNGQWAALAALEALWHACHLARRVALFDIADMMPSLLRAAALKTGALSMQFRMKLTQSWLFA